MNFQFSANHKHVERAIHVKKEIEFVGNKHAFRQLRNDNDFISQSIIELFLGFTTFYGIIEHFSICVREIGARSRKSGFINRTFTQHVKRLPAFTREPAYKYFQCHSNFCKFLVSHQNANLNFWIITTNLKLWEKRFSPSNLN